MRSLILAAAAAALIASPALAAKKAAAAPAAPGAVAAPAAAAPANSKGTSKMAACAAQWKALGDKGQQAYKDKSKGMKSKKGNPLSGYNVWTAECMKKA
jgi:hypothetical protein